MVDGGGGVAFFGGFTLPRVIEPNVLHLYHAK